MAKLNEKEDLKPENLNNPYREIADYADIATARKMYELLNGQQVIFTKRWYSKDYVKKYVREYAKQNLEGNLKGKNIIKELSNKFDYTDRAIRQMLNEKII